ncbi:MAG: NADH-quinone oxidoreductase subunit NuoE [Aquificaceae bacterium]
MLPKELLKNLEAIASSFPRREQSVLLCLHEVQDHYGYIPDFAIGEVAKIVGLSLNHVEGVVAFYDMFDTSSRASYRIRVCTSVVCNLLGSKRLLKALSSRLGIKPGEVTKDGKFKLIKVQCLGACSEAPCYMVNEDTYKFYSEEKLNEVLSSYT